MIVTYCVSGALCGEALEFLEPLPKGGAKPDLGWRLKISPFASLGSFAGGGLALCGYVRRFRPHPSLARHLPHPGEGFFRLCKPFLFYFSILLTNRRCLYILRNDRSSLPPGGEGGAPATDEGETGERTHVTHPANTNRQASILRPCNPRVISEQMTSS